MGFFPGRCGAWKRLNSAGGADREIPSHAAGRRERPARGPDVSGWEIFTVPKCPKSFPMITAETDVTASGYFPYLGQAFSVCISMIIPLLLCRSPIYTAYITMFEAKAVKSKQKIAQGEGGPHA